MSGNNFLNKMPYLPKVWSSVVYFCLTILVMLLFMGRKYESIQSDILLDIFPNFYSHISNFVISFMLCLVAGYIEILKSGKLKTTYFIAFLLLIANVVYEWFIPILNTPDKIDAYYGIVGTIIPFIYLFFFQKFGIKKKSALSEG